jgi:hypothetical protein
MSEVHEPSLTQSFSTRNFDFVIIDHHHHVSIMDRSRNMYYSEALFPYIRT